MAGWKSDAAATVWTGGGNLVMATGVGVVGRYIRVTANAAGDAVNLDALWALYKNNRYEPSDGDGGRSGPYSTADPTLYDWTNLRESDGKFAHNEGGNKDGYLQIGLGSERPIDRIAIVNRKDCCYWRANGGYVQILDNKLQVVWKAQITAVAAEFSFHPPDLKMTFDKPAYVLPYVLRVGPNNTSATSNVTKTVPMPGGDELSGLTLLCPTVVDPYTRVNTDFAGSPDQFAVQVNATDIKVTRPDRSLWSMDLQVPCRVGPYTPYALHVGPGTAGTFATIPRPSDLPAGVNLVCPLTVGPNTRLNTDYQGAPDTFQVEVVSTGAADGSVAVRRTDNPTSGWSMDLTVPCHTGPYRSFVLPVGSSGTSTKDVQLSLADVPEGAYVVCPTRVGPNERYPLGEYSDTFSVTPTGDRAFKIQRIDAPNNGWGVDLKIPCHIMK